MGVIVLTIFIASFSFIILAAKILSSLARIKNADNLVLIRVTLISGCCLLSMILTIAVLITYVALGSGTMLCEFACAWRLRVVRDLFQLIYLMGVVAAFAVHKMQASSHSSKSFEKPPARTSSMLADRGVDNIILDLAKNEDSEK